MNMSLSDFLQELKGGEEKQSVRQGQTNLFVIWDFPGILFCINLLMIVPTLWVEVSTLILVPDITTRTELANKVLKPGLYE